MSPYDPQKHIKTVFAIELLILATAIVIGYGFWNSICSTSLKECLLETNYIAPGYFLLLSIIRPFVFTPNLIFTMVAGDTFGPILGSVLASLGGVLSCVAVYILAKYVGKTLVNPWLRSNLPQTLKFIRSQDWKIVLACRLIPVLPFDLLSLVFGLVDFRFKYVVLMTFLGSLPEVYMLAHLGDPDTSALSSTIVVLSIGSVFFLLPGLIIEIYSRRKGTGMWVRLKAMWNEIMYEIQVNNDIVKKNSFSGKKVPILLVYGFFSSRRALTSLERQLTAKGYEVLSFNLGGLFGVFFTKGIIETANFIEYKLKRQFGRHGFDQVQIVAHSKGGLVALWWILKLGGHKHCKKLITMGTPFFGTNLTWLALITPLGFIWKDMWQMRPYSAFLKSLRKAKIPEGVEIYCLYSSKDKVSKGVKGIYRPDDQENKVRPVPLHHIGHFEFLYKRDVIDSIAHILGSSLKEDMDDSEEVKTVNK